MKRKPRHIDKIRLELLTNTYSDEPLVIRITVSSIILFVVIDGLCSFRLRHFLCRHCCRFRIYSFSRTNAVCGHTSFLCLRSHLVSTWPQISSDFTRALIYSIRSINHFCRLQQILLNVFPGIRIHHLDVRKAYR